MAFDQKIQLLNIPQYQDPTAGLRESLRYNRLVKQDKQDRLTQSLKDYTPVAEQQAIRNVLGNINQEGGVQLGLESQQELNDRYVALQTKYAPQLQKAAEMREQALASGLTTYDSQGNDTSDRTNPEVIELDKMLKDMTAEYDAALNAINTQAANSNYTDILNRVSNPKDAEHRLVQALMSKGIDANVARKQAANEMAQYAIPDLTKRQEAQIKALSDQNTLLGKIGITKQTSIKGTGSAKGKSTKGKSTSYSANKGLAEQLFTNSGIKDIKDEQSIGEIYDTINTDDLDSINNKVELLRNTGATDAIIYEALMNSIEGSGVKNGNKEFSLSAAAQYIKDNPNGTGKYNNTGGVYGSVSNTIQGLDPEIAKQIGINNSKINAVLSGGSRKTAKQNIDEMLGTNKVVKPKKTTTTTNTNKTSSKVKTKEEKNAYIEKLNKQGQEGVRSDLKGIKKEAPKKTIEEVIKKNLKDDTITIPSTYKENKNYGKTGNEVRKWFHNIFNSTTKDKSDHQIISENADKLNKVLGTFKPVKEVIKTKKVPFSSAVITEVIQESKTLSDYLNELGLTKSQIKALASNPKIKYPVRKKIADILKTSR